MRISTKGLTSSIRKAIEGTREEHPRSKTRTIGAGEAGRLADCTRKAIKLATPEDCVLLVRLVGGIVPNSYRGSAESDRVDVVVDLLTGQIHVVGTRTHAPTRPHGRGELLTVHLRKAGQTQGRRINL